MDTWTDASTTAKTCYVQYVQSRIKISHSLADTAKSQSNYFLQNTVYN